MKISTYVEKHHADLGAALFVLPVTAIAMVIAGLAYGVSWLLS
jgi:hypothetical protein